MDSCLGVEQDLDKAITKFNSLNDHTNRVLQDIIDQVENVRKEIAKQPPNTPLSQTQSMVVSDLASSVKQTVFQISTEHRELHATVSRVGKSIDRHFIADYAAVAPKAESFCSDTNRPIMEQAIAQHLYRQGLEEVGDAFVTEAQITGVERTCTFALLQRCAATLADGDPSAALQWVERRKEELQHSPLRQQASEQNPPMRLLCGHVISRDALNKLALGAKLKCPYCPMEQSPAEARQIYFS